MNEKEKYHFWNDEDSEIRTCVECKYSEIKTSDGDWVGYLTLERINFLFYNDFSTKCSICSGE